MEGRGGGWVNETQDFDRRDVVRVPCDAKSQLYVINATLRKLFTLRHVTYNPKPVTHLPILTKTMTFFSKPNEVVVLPKPNHDRFTMLKMCYSVFHHRGSIS